MSGLSGGALEGGDRRLKGIELGTTEAIVHPATLLASFDQS